MNSSATPAECVKTGVSLRLTDGVGPHLGALGDELVGRTAGDGGGEASAEGWAGDGERGAEHCECGAVVEVV